jgi:hypothetical protein
MQANSSSIVAVTPPAMARVQPNTVVLASARHLIAPVGVRKAVLPRARHTDLVIKDAALDYMRDHHLAGPLVGKLASPQQRRFSNGKA